MSGLVQAPAAATHPGSLVSRAAGRVRPRPSPGRGAKAVQLRLCRVRSALRGVRGGRTNSTPSQPMQSANSLATWQMLITGPPGGQPSRAGRRFAARGTEVYPTW
eukprot:scaffold154_cov373-Prasinococcus_capsulatus_cf.AAC.5